MADSTGQSDQIMSAAGKSLALQRDGGVHRHAGKPIGKGSAGLRRKVWFTRIKYLAGAIFAIFIAATVAGLVLDGIGFAGVMAVALAVVAASWVFTNFPKVKIPKRADLKKGDAPTMVGRTELWLESQRAALPPPAVQLVDQLGVQLDALGLQLETIDPNHPVVGEVRELVGEYIPETIENYRRIPEQMRQQDHAGKTADQRVTESLGKLSQEVDRVTRRLAEGALDDLAIKSRYLEYRYGGAEALEDHSK